MHNKNTLKNGPSRTLNKSLFYLLLAITIITVYWPLKDNHFINFDDDLYVYENENVKKGLTVEGIQWAFRFNDKGYWHPLTWLSHMTDCELFGLDPARHHFHSLMIHLANALLLFLILYRITGRFYRSAFVAALFAVHPLNVDSVAWLAERKNLLSTFWGMISLLLYGRYVERPNPARYTLTLISFALGLMAKPMLVTLPFVFLLLDFWPFKRMRYFPQQGREFETAEAEKTALQQTAISKLIVEKMPFFALSLGAVWLSILSNQHINTMVAADTVPMTLRIGNALVSYIGYIGKMIWPFHLAVYYPFPEAIQLWQVMGMVVLLIAVTGLFICGLNRRPYLAVGWFWYLGTLVPVIGILQNGLWPAMADRWAYVPMIGLFIIISWGLPDIAVKWRYRKPALIILAISIIAFFSITTRIQLQHWRNSTTLFEHALAVTKNNYVAQNNLGNAHAKEGNLPKAINHYRESIRLKPDHAKAYNNLGIALAKQGKVKDAIRHYSEALRLNSGYAQAYNNLGVALTEQGQVDEAIQSYNRALELKPDYAEAHNNLGVALKKQGQIPEAAKHYYKALRLDPKYAAPHYNLGLAFFQFGKVKKSIYHFRRALQINPAYRDAQKSLKTARKVQNRSKVEKLPIQGTMQIDSQNL
jgi:tetratricopeptide (TPR) repeat protein